ncbi:MAG: DUF2065 domain-containing protein [bacterium]|nr:DUF2065 domain-containing protein [bacterium]
MPFANPARWRGIMRLISEQSDRSLRIIGLISMLVGIMLLYLVRNV